MDLRGCNLKHFPGRTHGTLQNKILYPPLHWGRTIEGLKHWTTLGVSEHYIVVEPHCLHVLLEVEKGVGNKVVPPNKLSGRRQSLEHWMGRGRLDQILQVEVQRPRPLDTTFLTKIPTPYWHVKLIQGMQHLFVRWQVPETRISNLI